MRMISYVTEFYQRIGSCVVVVVLRAVDTRRRLHPYNDHTLWRLGGAGTRSVLLEIAVLRHDLIYDTDAVERPLRPLTKIVYLWGIKPARIYLCRRS